MLGGVERVKVWTLDLEWRDGPVFFKPVCVKNLKTLKNSKQLPKRGCEIPW